MTPKSQSPNKRRLRGALLFASLTGCVGDIGDSLEQAPEAGSTEALCLGHEPNVGPTPLRRLSPVEYENTLRDLFAGVDLGPIKSGDAPVDEGFENDTATQVESPLLIDGFADTARAVTSSALASPAFRDKLPCEPATTADQAACGQAVIEAFGARAFRRPMTTEQVASFVSFFEVQREAIDYDAALELTLAALLQSPQFLYRVETAGSGGDGDVVPLDDWELASRLSYFVWGSMPDSELFDAAAAGTLREKGTLEVQVRRMLKDARAERQVVDFHRQWLGFDGVESAEKEPSMFPDWTPELRSAAREELDRFVRRVAFDGSGTLGELLTSATTEVNAELAALYGVSPPASGWATVTLSSKERAGILTTAGFLAHHAHSTNGSPPLRGAAVLRQVLCSDMPDPPEDADISTPVSAPGDAPKTNRQLFEERTSSAECQGCHHTLDNIGFGFEGFDAIGRFRAADNSLPVDASGELFGTDVDARFEGAVELAALLQESEQVSTCYVRHWFRFERGRLELPNDDCQIATLRDDFVASGGDIRELIVSLVLSAEFAQRSTTEP